MFRATVWATPMLQKTEPKTDDRKVANARLASCALLLGNFVTGVCVLAPAAMLPQLATGLDVTIRDAGLLVTYGAIVLCIGSPLMSWATSRIDRRLLLGGTLAIVTMGHVASALAPNYETLLAFRLLMLVAAVLFTPQAAGTISLIVPEKERPSAVSFVFVGWTLSIAAGLPLVTYLAAHLGWREAYLVLGVAAMLVCVLIAFALPAGLQGTAISFRSWSRIVHNRCILLLLLITILSACGGFVLFTYMAPLLSRLTGAGPTETAIFFGIFGAMGFVGNLATTRIVSRLSAFATSFLAQSAMLLGALIWSIGAGSLTVMAIGMASWGLGFAAGNSMQQARLISAGPELATASVALNTSSIYIGQAIGSGIGGLLLTQGLYLQMGYVAAACLAAALLVLPLTRTPQCT
jgi:DHA1 family inner membrane transport protein